MLFILLLFVIYWLMLYSNHRRILTIFMKVTQQLTYRFVCFQINNLVINLADFKFNLKNL